MTSDRDPLWRSRPSAFDIAPAAPGRTRAINDFIQLSEGNSNSYMVRTRDGRIVVNTGMGYEAPIHKAHFDAVDASPVRYIVLTQGHVDHVGGVDVFREPGTEIVAHANNPAQQAYDARLATFRTRRAYFAWAQSIDRKTPASGPPPVQSRPRPTILVDDHYAFTLGGLRVELFGCAGAETVDSLIMWLPERRICFTGNVFGALFGHFPNLVTLRGDRHRDALAYVGALDLLLGLDAEMLLVGHFGPVVGRDVIRAELERMKGAVLHVHDTVVDAMNSGGDVHAVMRDVTLPPALAVGEGYGKVSWSARAVWETYQGWFHGRSTTELYPVPSSAAYPTLVTLAGGPDEVAAAAAAKVTDAPLEALHLAEAALAVDPRHRRALEASHAAHRRLLAESTNFWETRWLEHEIRRLEAALATA
jgi:alkyl sulfatase BDS1-like metallo-beta-lactamase superfamily hydrolase